MDERKGSNHWITVIFEERGVSSSEEGQQQQHGEEKERGESQVSSLDGRRR